MSKETDPIQATRAKQIKDLRDRGVTWYIGPLAGQDSSIGNESLDKAIAKEQAELVEMMGRISIDEEETAQFEIPEV